MISKTTQAVLNFFSLSSLYFITNIVEYLYYYYYYNTEVSNSLEIIYIFHLTEVKLLPTLNELIFFLNSNLLLLCYYRLELSVTWLR